MDDLSLAKKLLGNEQTKEDKAEQIDTSSASIVYMIAVTSSSGGEVVLRNENESEQGDWLDGDFVEIDEDGDYEEYESEDDDLEDVDDSVVDMTDGDGANIEDDGIESIAFTVTDYQTRAQAEYLDENEAEEDDLPGESTSISDETDDGDATELPDDGQGSADEDDLSDENAEIQDIDDGEYTLIDDNLDDESDDIVTGAEISDGYTVADCIGAVNEGDRVAVMVQNGRLTVIGVAGSGDEMNANMTEVFDNIIATNIKVDNLQATKADIETLNATNATIDKLRADIANIGDLEALNATLGNLQATKANIDLANIQDGCITTAMLGTEVVGTSQIANSSITDAKIVELTANKITAGELSCDRLIINGTDKSLVYYLNNMGDLTSTQVNTLNGDTLTSRSITADKIVANAITSNEIASKTITANNIASGTITSAEIQAGSINADRLNVNDIFSKNITATGTISGATLQGGKINGATMEGGVIDGAIVRAQELTFRMNKDQYASGYLAYDANINQTQWRDDNSIDIWSKKNLSVRSNTYLSVGSGDQGQLGYIKFNNTAITIGGYTGSTLGISVPTTVSNTLTTTGAISTSSTTINYTSAYSNEIGLTCKWADGNTHNMLTRSTNGLTCSFGYDGGSSCKTISIMRGYSLRFGCGGNNGTSDARGVIKFDYDGTNVYLRPTTTGVTYLGSASYRWATIYTNASVNTSDRREKHDINYDVSDEMIDLIYNSKPVSYIYNSDKYDIKRYGMIAQDVRDYLVENNLEKFGGITVDDKVKEIPRDINASEEEVIYGISYEQYIAPLIATVQHQKQQIDDMRNELNELKELVSQLLVK